MKIRISKQAEKFIRKQDPKTIRRILLALDGLKEKPFQGDIKTLKGRPELRLRVGDFRIIFEEAEEIVNEEVEKVINILTIDNRGDVYKK